MAFLRPRGITSSLVVMYSLMIQFMGCGWYKDSPANAEQMSDLSSGGCKVNSQELRLFLEKEIPETLNCLKQQLKIYSQVNQMANPGEINQGELKTFLNSFLKNGADADDGITTLFTVYEHIYAGDNRVIPVKDLDKIFDFLIKINKEAGLIYQYYQVREREEKITIDEYRYLKSNSDEAFKRLTQIIGDNILPHNKTFHELSTKKILQLVGFEANEKLINDSKKIRHLKRLFLGGDHDRFTFDEIKNALGKLPRIGPLILDLLMFNNITFNTEKERLFFLQDILHSFEETIYISNSKHQIYFSVDDLIEIASSIKSVPFDVKKYRESLIELKRSSLIGGDENFTYQDIKKILSHIDQIVGINIAVTEIWNYNTEILLSPLKIDPKLVAMPPSASKHTLDFFDQFKKIIKTYKYFPKDDGSSTYGVQYLRSRQGIIRVALYEYAVAQFIKAYGNCDDGSKKLDLTKDQFLNIIMAYQDFVIDLNFWRNPIYKMVNSQFLMADFFRNHSNGNGQGDLEEIVGIAMMDVSSAHLATKTFPALKEGSEQAGYPLIKFDEINPLRSSISGEDAQIREDFVGVSTEYFYKNFTNWLSSMRDSFPLLYKDLLSLNEEERFTYARSISMFTRHCPFDYLDPVEVPLQTKDLTLMLGGMISIEETFIRFDENQNQKLDYPELEKVVAHFTPAIFEVMRQYDFNTEKKSAADLARTVFYYLIVNQELPMNDKGKINIIKMGAFHLKLKTIMKEEKISANRALLSKVLLALSPRDKAPRKECFDEKVYPD